MVTLCLNEWAGRQDEWWTSLGGWGGVRHKWVASIDKSQAEPLGALEGSLPVCPSLHVSGGQTTGQLGHCYFSVICIPLFGNCGSSLLFLVSYIWYVREFSFPEMILVHLCAPMVSVYFDKFVGQHPLFSCLGINYLSICVLLVGQDIYVAHMPTKV